MVPVDEKVFHMDNVHVFPRVHGIQDVQDFDLHSSLVHIDPPVFQKLDGGDFSGLLVFALHDLAEGSLSYQFFDFILLTFGVFKLISNSNNKVSITIVESIVVSHPIRQVSQSWLIVCTELWVNLLISSRNVNSELEQARLRCGLLMGF